MSGRDSINFSTSSRPFIPGITTSVITASMNLVGSLAMASASTPPPATYTVGMRQIGEHLVQVVDLMVENNRQQAAR